MEDFILRFGKYKGCYFSSTPKSYQDWLAKQNWFIAKRPNELNKVQKTISNLADSLSNWNGSSLKGQAIYDRLFEAEKQMDDLIFNTSDQTSPYYNGEW